MDFAGIIAEYDPFHNGHALQIAMLRQRGAKNVAVCLSAGAVQRGGVPVLPERVRAEAALRAGADLVVALPAPYANASAETFAAAGVRLLAALGCDTLAFGAETPDSAAFCTAASALLDSGFPAQLRTALDAGLPFAAARARAAGALCPGAEALLQTPNNILGVEYAKAVQSQNAPLRLLPLPRLGVRHGGEETGAQDGTPLASASQIRAVIRARGLDAVQPYLPPQAFELYRQAAAQGLLLSPEKFDTALLALLRRQTPQTLRAVRGAGEGLENRLYAAARAALDADDLYARLKTKRYPTARLRRLALDAALGIPAEGWPALPPYLLVLGARRAALPMLKNAALPASTGLANLAQVNEECRAVADLHSRAVDFSSLCRIKTQPAGLAYTNKVVIL